MDHNIILFTSSFTQQVIDKGQGGDMVSVWDDDNNEIILNVGVLMLFWRRMVWVGVTVMMQLTYCF